jgi:hypothetical protein
MGRHLDIENSKIDFIRPSGSRSKNVGMQMSCWKFLNLFEKHLKISKIWSVAEELIFGL